MNQYNNIENLAAEGYHGEKARFYLYSSWSPYNNLLVMLSKRKLHVSARQARSQPQDSKGAPATSKGAHNLHSKKVVTKSPSQPITARGSGGAL